MTLRLCLLGCGSVAKLHSWIARTMRRRVRLLYASRSLEKAKAYQKRFGGVGAFGSYEDACASPEVDAVFICTPHAFHLDHARIAVRHGKPMLIEKPVTRTLAELSALESAVASAGVPCMVAENYHFKPLLRVLQQSIQAGDIGEVSIIEWNRTARSNPGGWRGDETLMGGGALLEGGVHWINALCTIGGEVSEVLGARPSVASDRTAPLEDTMLLTLRFRSGAIGKLLHSWNLPPGPFGLQMSKIYGTAGVIRFESNGVYMRVKGRRTRLRFPGLLDIMGYRAMLAHFVTSVGEGRPPAMSLAVARRDLSVVAAAYRSLETGRFEPLTS